MKQLAEVQSQEKQGEVRIPKKLFLLDTGLVTLLLLTWTIPGAYYWHIAEEKDAVLPYLPRLLWIVPGALWDSAPWGFGILLVAAPLTYHLLRGNRRRLKPSTRFMLLTALALVALINWLWGRAIV